MLGDVRIDDVGMGLHFFYHVAIGRSKPRVILEEVRMAVDVGDNHLLLCVGIRFEQIGVTRIVVDDDFIIIVIIRLLKKIFHTRVLHASLSRLASTILAVNKYLLLVVFLVTIAAGWFYWTSLLR
jgi:hypothetical protein